MLWVEAGYYKQLWPRDPLGGEASKVLPGAPGIASGASVAAFAITLPAMDLAYVRGHATVDVGSTLNTVELTMGNDAPPVITFNVNRLN